MYELIMTSNARRDLRRLDTRIQTQILRKLRWLCENCDGYLHKALKGRYRGQFKLPSGDYRTIYTYNKQVSTIEVSRIGHRSFVYE